MTQTTGATPPTDVDSGATEQAKEKASEVAGQAQEKAQQAADQAKGQLRSQVDQRSTEVGEKVTTTAADIRSVGEQLRAQGKEGPAKLSDQAAQHAERIGGYLTQSDPDRILADVEDFARRQPWAVVAGGLALGFAASRFLKASSTQRYRQVGATQTGAPRAIPAPTGGNGHSQRPVGSTGTGAPLPPSNLGHA